MSFLQETHVVITDENPVDVQSAHPCAEQQLLEKTSEHEDAENTKMSLLLKLKSRLEQLTQSNNTEEHPEGTNDIPSTVENDDPCPDAAHEDVGNYISNKISEVEIPFVGEATDLYIEIDSDDIAGKSDDRVVSQSDLGEPKTQVIEHEEVIVIDDEVTEKDPGGVEVDNPFFCVACNVDCKNETTYHNHTRGLTHTMKCSQIKVRPDNEESPKVKQSLSKDDKKPGRKPLPVNDEWIYDSISNTYHCEVCDCTMTGPTTFQAHLEGSRHRKNAKSRMLGAPIKKPGSKLAQPGRYSRVVKRDPKIQDMIDKCKEPLVGVEYMCEYCQDDADVEPRYVCNLCEAKTDSRMAVQHLTGLKHRLAYMSKHQPNYAILLQQLTRKSNQSSTAEEYAREIEAKLGREKMMVRVEESCEPHDSHRAASRHHNPTSPRSRSRSRDQRQRSRGYHSRDRRHSRYRSRSRSRSPRESSRAWHRGERNRMDRNREHDRLLDSFGRNPVDLRNAHDLFTLLLSQNPGGALGSYLNSALLLLRNAAADVPNDNFSHHHPGTSMLFDPPALNPQFPNIFDGPSVPFFEAPMSSGRTSGSRDSDRFRPHRSPRNYDEHRRDDHYSDRSSSYQAQRTQDLASLVTEMSSRLGSSENEAADMAGVIADALLQYKLMKSQNSGQ